MRIVIAACLWLACLVAPAAAYVGPGAGLSVIGSAFAFLGVIFLLVLGFLWYPFKRLLAGVRGGGSTAREEGADEIK